MPRKQIPKRGISSMQDAKTSRIKKALFTARRASFLAGSLLLIFIGFPPWAWAEEISFDQALERFYKNNYDILINRYEIDKAYADYVGAKLRPNPTLSTNIIGLGYSRGYPRATDDTQFTVRIDQLLELGGKREYRTQAALATQQAVSLSHKDVIRNLLIGFYTVYYNLQLDRLNTGFATEELERFGRILDIAERRFNAGFLSYLDTEKIRLAKIDLENNLTNVQSQYRKDVENFDLLIGAENAIEPYPLTLRDEFSQFTEAELVETALKNRYDLFALEKQREAARQNISLAKALRIPDLSVGAEHDSFGTDANSRLGGGISIGLPIFNRAQGAILRSNAEFKQIEEQIKKTKRVILSDVRQALISYRTSAAIFETYRSRRASMEDLLSRSEAAFTLGGITVLDLLDTRRTYRDFISKYNQSLVQVLLNRELIKVYTGEVR
jgi:outer membrane protein, heavy metal efflux system